MIQSFKHKGLKNFFKTGSLEGINANHAKRLRLILGRLNISTTAQDMQLPGLKLHRLKGSLQEYYAVSISGNWRLIFRIKDSEIFDVDYLDYH